MDDLDDDQDEEPALRDHGLVRMIAECWRLAPTYPGIWDMSFAQVRYLGILREEDRKRELLQNAIAVRAAGDQSEKAEGWKGYTRELEK